MTRHLEVRPGTYRDSVSLLRVGRSVGDLPGVGTALVGMATPLNLELIRQAGFELPDDPGTGDLVVAVEADDDERLRAALDQLEQVLAERVGGTETTATASGPRTTGGAAGDATLALVSTPGRTATIEALDALAAGMSVMVFSDNVPLTDEIRLKDEAAGRGLLVMGPDCGTAVVAGVGLGFANVVRPGPVGLVAASGTGAQQLMCLLDGAGVGVSHCLGVGGRDLSAEVGGRSTLAALDLLAADPATEIVLVVSKPAAARVERRIRERAGKLGKPVLFAVLGADGTDLTAAAEEAVLASGGSWAAPRSWPAGGSEPGSGQGRRAPAASRGSSPALRGLFSGGTLCDEAMLIAVHHLGEVRSNIPLRPEWGLGPDMRHDGHVMVDFGDDALTQGRPHPMIDWRLRLTRLADEAADPRCGVVLLDVVLGHGAHPDPAAELAPAVTAARETAAAGGRDLAVVVTVVGSEADPQGLDRQAGQIAESGASVHLSNAAATREAVELVAWT